MIRKIFISLFVLVLLIGIVFSAGETTSPTASNTVEVGNTEKPIGDLIGEGLDITASKVELTKEENENTLTFLEGGSVNIEGASFKNIEKSSSIVLDDLGEIKSADLTANADTSFDFKGVGTYTVLKGERVKYEGGKATIYGKAGNSVGFTPEILDESGKDIGKIMNIKMNGESINFEKNEEGNNILTGNFDMGTSKINGRITLSKEEKISEIWKGTDATVNNVNFKVSGNNLNTYYDENFNPEDHNGENYFNYKKDKISIGGDGFTSDLTKSTNIFGNMKTTNEVNGIGTKTRDLDITMNGGNLQISRDTSNSKDLAFNVNGNGDYVINDGREVIYSQKSPVKAGESPGADEIFVKTNLREGSSYNMSSSYNINLNNGEYMLKDNLFEDRSGNVLVNANTPWENTVYNRLNSITTPDEIAEIEKITGNGTYRNWDFILKDEYLDKTIFDAAEGANISAATFASFAAGEGWFYSSNYDNNSNQYINTPWDKLKENYSTELLAGEVGLTGIAGYFNNLKEGGFIPPNSSLIYYDLLGTTKAKIKGEDVPTFFAGTIKYFESLAKESVGEEEWDNSTDSDKLALTTYIFNSGKPAGESIYNPVAVEKDYNGNNPLKNSKIREAMYLDFKNYLTYP